MTLKTPFATNALLLAVSARKITPAKTFGSIPLLFTMRQVRQSSSFGNSLTQFFILIDLMINPCSDEIDKSNQELTLKLKRT